MTLVTTSNLAKMNKDRFQKVEPVTPEYPPVDNADGFKNPSLGNSFLRKDKEDTIFQHTSIQNNYGYHIGTNGQSIAQRNAFFKNSTFGNSYLQKDEDTIFQHTTIQNNYGYGIKIHGQGKAERDAFFKNPTPGFSFKKNH